MYSQLKIERMSSVAKDTRIKTLEYLIIKQGYDPRYVKADEEIIKHKNANIQALQKQLILPTT